jgi:hypothetical protein
MIDTSNPLKTDKLPPQEDAYDKFPVVTPVPIANTQTDLYDKFPIVKASEIKDTDPYSTFPVIEPASTPQSAQPPVLNITTQQPGEMTGAEKAAAGIKAKPAYGGPGPNFVEPVIPKYTGDEESYGKIIQRAISGWGAAGAEAGQNIQQGVWDTIHQAGDLGINFSENLLAPITDRLGPRDFSKGPEISSPSWQRNA